MRFLFRLMMVAGLLAGVSRAADTVHIAPPPAWAVDRPADKLPATPAADASYGYDFLMLDQQVMVTEQATFRHDIYRVTNEGTLQSAARISLDFDPSYEDVTLHHVRVIRDGQVEDRLPKTPIKTIQRERDLDRHMLNGELTALLVLEDIRVGDVIDYAYTRRGWNPVFGGRYFSWVTTGWSVPVRWQNFCLITPAGRGPATQSHGPGVSQPLRTKYDHNELIVWTKSDAAPITAEKETPRWHESYASMQLSEFKEWSEVVRWAEPLFALPDPLPEAVRAEAARLTAGLTAEEAKTMALLQFVQQQVRYLGMELGTGSYRPSPPEVVLARRFGDCKDKVLLFCALARAAHITAYPAFVNTTYLDRVEDWLPTPQAFDHVIAEVMLEDGTGRWVDPTLSYQQGGFDTRGVPDYRRALVVRPGNDQFSVVRVPPEARSTTKVEERFESPAFDRPAEFHVRTVMTGRTADYARAEFALSPIEEISKKYVNYYASMMPGLTVAQLPRVTDDVAANRVTVEESYMVPNLWKKDETGRWVAEFMPKMILDWAARPNTTVRTTPLAVAYPGFMELTTTAHLPEDWTVVAREQTMESDGFRGTSGISCQGREVVMNYKWETLADHVEPERVAAHVAALLKFREALGHTLTYKPPLPGAPAATAAHGFRLNWLLVLVSLITLAGGVFVIRAIHARASVLPPLLAEPGPVELTGLGGWLVLVGIRVVAGPVWLLIAGIIPHRLSFNQARWEAMTIPDRASYQEWLGAVIMGEVVGSLLVITLGVWAAVLFFRRHRFFPGVYIATLISTFLLSATDSLGARHLITVSETALKEDPYRLLAPVILSMVVWIPYMLISKRVKYTFTR